MYMYLRPVVVGREWREIGESGQEATNTMSRNQHIALISFVVEQGVFNTAELITLTRGQGNMDPSRDTMSPPLPPGSLTSR